MSISDWMRQEEEIYKGLNDLEPTISNTDVQENTQSSQKNVKHDVGKVILGVREQDRMPEIVVEEEDLEKVLMFIQEVNRENEEKRKEEEKMKKAREDEER